MNWCHRRNIPWCWPILHAGIWWGVVLLAIGLFYTIRFYPRKLSK